MATKTAIGIRREMAMTKLHRVMDELYGEGFTLPTQGRDPDLLHAVQLEYIADYLECQAQGLSTKVEIDLGAIGTDATVSLPVDMPTTKTIVTAKPAPRRKVGKQ